MTPKWLRRARAWGKQHPRLSAGMEAAAFLSSIVVAFWAVTIFAASALLIGTRTARHTPSHEGILIGPVGKVGWILTGGMFLLGALIYGRYLQRTLPQLPKACLLPLCIASVGFALLIDTVCGRMSTLVTIDGDNDWVNAALKLWTWSTYALCATPVAEWMARHR